MQCYRSYWKSKYSRSRGKRDWDVDIIFGKKEPFVARPDSEEAMDWFQTCRLHLLEGGHWPFLSHTLQFNQTLDSLLEEQYGE